MTDDPNASRDSLVLLTATVDPGETVFVARRDPLQRLQDYKTTLRWWLRNIATPAVIFCENSNYDLTEIREIIERHNPFNKKVEILTFDGRVHPPHLGKGYGEMKIIAYALKHSGLIGLDTRIVKVTGRYCVQNYAHILRSIIAERETEIFCDFRGSLSWCPSQIFCGTTAFFTRYLLPLGETLNDSEGIDFEIVLARAVHRAMAEGHKWSMLPEAPDIHGIRATDNRPLARPRWRWIRTEMVHRLQRHLAQW
jgi:hypothetical protein